MPKSKIATRKLTLDEKIRISWDAHEDSEPDISTERLMAMVSDDTGADYDQIISAVMSGDMQNSVSGDGF